MSIDYKKLFIGLIVATILTLPVASALKNANNRFEIQRSENDQLKLDIQKSESEIDQLQIQKNESEDQLKQKNSENEKLKQENDQLQKDLQAKRAKQAEEARLAAVRAAEAKKQAEQQAQAAVAVSGDCYAAELAKYDWNVATMQRIMRAESGCNPTNHNYGDNHRSCLGSFGLLQIGCVHGYSVAYLSNPVNNIAAAYKIYKSQGYTAWTTY